MTTNDAVTLEPCPNPWCDNNEGVSPSVHTVTGRWHICCDDCMIEGPWADSRAEAIAAWNRCTPPAPRMGDVEARWREWTRSNTPPMDGEWFVARSTVPNWSAIRVVHYADKDHRLPIDHSGWVWPSEPNQWMPLSEFAALRAAPSDEGRTQELEQKLRMVVSHATGGASSDIDRSTNDICVAITDNRNLIYQAGKDTARRAIEAMGGTPVDDAPSDEGRETAWRCTECGCRTYTHVDERQPDGSFAPGEVKRCVNCKRDFTPIEAMGGAVVDDAQGGVANAALFLCERLREFEPSTEDDAREFHGHIAPPLARLEALLAGGGK